MMTKEYRPSPLTMAAHAKGMTLAQLGETVGLSRATIAHVASGTIAPSPRVLEAIMTSLDVTENEARALCPRKRGDGDAADSPARFYLTMKSVRVSDLCERLPHLSRSGIRAQLRQLVSPHEELVLVVEELTGVARELLFPRAFVTDAATFGGAS